MSGAGEAANSPAGSYCTPVSSQASTPLSRDAASPFPADDAVKPRRPAPTRDAGMRAVLLDRFGRDEPDEESSEGKEWRAAGAAVVHDLSDVLEHVARSDFALGCGDGA